MKKLCIVFSLFIALIISCGKDKTVAPVNEVNEVNGTETKDYGSITIRGDFNDSYDFTEGYYYTDYHLKNSLSIGLYDTPSCKIIVSIYFVGITQGTCECNLSSDHTVLLYIINYYNGRSYYSSNEGAYCKIDITKLTTKEIRGTFGGLLKTSLFGEDDSRSIFVSGNFIVPEYKEGD